MEPVRMTIAFPHGGEETLENPLSVSLVSTLESPAQSLAASFPLGRGGAPEAAVTAMVYLGERRVFAGWCDQQTAREDQGGRVLSLQARSRGGFLLDNEALPRTYYSVTCREIFRSHLAPYGFAELAIPRDLTAGIFTVPKGKSEWEVFCDFCMRMYARLPMVTPGERVVVEERPKSPGARITNRSGEEGLRYLRAEEICRRASVVSEVLLRDKKGNYSRALGNPFGNPWQVRRRRYVIPAAEYATAPAADGYQRFREAQRGARTAEAVLPGWAELWAGDCVALETGLGTGGSWTVWRRKWDLGEGGAYTTLTLTRPELS